MASRPVMDAALREALLAQRDLGVALCEADGQLSAVNEALQDMLGKPFSPTGPASWSAQFAIHDESGEHPLPPYGDPLGRAMTGQRVADQVISVHLPETGVRFLRCNAHRLHDRRGRVVGGVVFVVDVTREVTYRRDVDVLRERLIDTVNHELRTPLAAVKGHLELLQEHEGQLPAPARWSVTAIARGLARLETVLDLVRELTEPTSAVEPRAAAQTPAGSDPVQESAPGRDA